MIVAGVHNITIRPGGAAWSQSLALKDSNNVAVDVSAYAPFRAQVRLESNKSIILNGTVNDSDADTGILIIAFPGSTALSRTKVTAKWDLIDQFGDKWIYGSATIDPTITAP